MITARAAKVLAFTLASKILAATTIVLLIRHLPVEEYAKYTVILALATFLTNCVSTGVNRIYIVSYRDHFEGSPRGPLVSLQVLTVIALGTALFLPLALSPWHGLVAIVLAMGLLLTEYGKTELQRLERFTQFGTLELARSMSRLLAVGGLIAVGGVWLTASAVSLAQAIGMLSLMLPLLYFLGLHRSILNWRQGIKVFRLLISGSRKFLFGYFLLQALFAKLDIFMLSSLSDSQNTAAYGAAYQYYSLLLLALGAVHAVLLPEIAKANTKSEVRDMYNQHFRLAMAFTPVVICTIVAAYWVLPWIDYGRYPEAVPAFSLLAVSSIASFAFSPYSHLAVRFQGNRPLAALMSACLVLNAALNFWLIPSLGAVGAAVATLTSYLFLNAGIFRLAKRLTDAQGEFLVRRAP